MKQELGDVHARFAEHVLEAVDLLAALRPGGFRFQAVDPPPDPAGRRGCGGLWNRSLRLDAEGEELVLTITELQASIESLKRAKYSSVKRVQFTDRAVEYNTFAEVDWALRAAEEELSALQATAPAGFTVASHSGD